MDFKPGSDATTSRSSHSRLSCMGNIPKASSASSSTQQRLPVNQRRHKVAPVQRKRVATCCNSCNVKRIKCSGERPCLQCRNTFRECQYPIVVEKISIPRAELDELKVKCAQLEACSKQAAPDENRRLDLLARTSSGSITTESLSSMISNDSRYRSLPDFSGQFPSFMFTSPFSRRQTHDILLQRRLSKAYVIPSTPSPWPSSMRNPLAKQILGFPSDVIPSTNHAYELPGLLSQVQLPQSGKVWFSASKEVEKEITIRGNKFEVKPFHKDDLLQDHWMSSSLSELFKPLSVNEIGSIEDIHSENILSQMWQTEVGEYPRVRSSVQLSEYVSNVSKDQPDQTFHTQENDCSGDQQSSESILRENPDVSVQLLPASTSITPSLGDASQCLIDLEAENATGSESDWTSTPSPDPSDSSPESPQVWPTDQSDFSSPASVRIGDRGSSFISQLFNSFEVILQKRLRFMQCPESRASSTSQANSGTFEVQNSGQQQTEAPSNKKRDFSEDQNEDEPDPSGYGQGGGSSRLKRAKIAMTKKKIACPYVKRHPVEFSTWRTCPGPGFDGMNRMKEHLKRRHFKQYCCGRCGKYFSTGLVLREHSRAPEPCQVHDVPQPLGFMNQLQWDEIHGKRGNGVDTSERWKEIYRVLFPEVLEDHIPGPYHDVAETVNQLGRLIDPSEYEAYLRQHLPRCILGELDKEFQIMAEQARQRLVEIVQEQSSEILARFLREKGLITRGEENDGKAQEPQIHDTDQWDFLNDQDTWQFGNFESWCLDS